MSAAYDETSEALQERPSEQGSWGLEPKWLLVLMLSVPAAATTFWWFGTTFLQSQLTLFEHWQFSILLAVVVTGGYQLYFWVQRNNYHRPARCLKIDMDDKVPFWPSWIWLYSVFYYVAIGLTVTSVESMAAGVDLITGGVFLLIVGVALCYVFPTYVPESYRDYEVTGLSTRYLAFVQSIDNSRNALPSMHCAIAAYVGLSLAELPVIGTAASYGLTILIIVSCLVVKQHVILDTVAGTALGVVVFLANKEMTAVLH